MMGQRFQGKTRRFNCVTIVWENRPVPATVSTAVPRNYLILNPIGARNGNR